MFTRPNKISNEIKLLGRYQLTDAFVVLLILFFGMGNLADYIYEPIRLFFRLFLFIMTIFWLSPSPFKPQSKNISVLMDCLKKDTHTYFPDGIFENEWRKIDDYR